MDDERIVELYLLGDEGAISQSAAKYGSRLRSLAYGIVRDTQTAEECENDTYMQAWNSIPPHEPRTYLYAFLARITRCISLNRCRERSALKRNAFISELSTELEQCIAAPNDMDCRIDDMVFADVINGFLRGLTEEKRNIFIRRYFYADSVAEISKAFALSESKVKTTLYRCRMGLRERLEKEGYVL